MERPVNNKEDFVRQRVSAWKILVNKYFAASDMAGIVGQDENSDGIRGPFEKVTSSNTANVYKATVNFSGREHVLYVKEYLFRSLTDVLKHQIFRSRAKRSFIASLMLTQNGLLCPEVIAIGEKKTGPLLLKNFLITRDIGETENYYKTITQWDDSSETRDADRGEFVRQLGVYIGTMHAKGIFHGDLRPGNILVNRINGMWRFYLIDNERTKRYWRIPSRLRFKNLVQISMLNPMDRYAEDREHFFQGYLEQNPKLAGTTFDTLKNQVIQRACERIRLKQQKR